MTTQQTLPIKTTDMDRVLTTFREWGGSITALALKENIRIRSMSMARQETAIRECVRQGYIRLNTEDWPTAWEVVG